MLKIKRPEAITITTTTASNSTGSLPMDVSALGPMVCSPLLGNIPLKRIESLIGVYPQYPSSYSAPSHNLKRPPLTPIPEVKTALFGTASNLSFFAAASKKTTEVEANKINGLEI